MVIIRATAQSVKRAVSVVQATPDGRRVVSLRGEGSTSVIEVWDGNSGDRIRAFRDGEGLVVGVTITPDGERVTSKASPGKSWIWEVQTGEKIEAEGEVGSAPTKDRWSAADGLLVLTRDDEGSVRVLEDETGTCLISRQLVDPPHRIRSVTQGARYLIGGGWDGPLHAWDLHHGGDPRILEGSDVKGPVVLSPCGGYLAAKVKQGLAVWTVGSWTDRFSCGVGLGERAWLTALAATRDAAFIISGSSDGMVAVWDACSGECTMRFPAVSGISALAVWGTLLAAGTEFGAVHLLRLSDVSVGPSVVFALPSRSGGYRYRCGDCGALSVMESLGDGLVVCPRCGEEQRVEEVGLELVRGSLTLPLLGLNLP